MPKPLQSGDPRELGPFRLWSRLGESAAGIVYLGVDPHGRPVTVALLTVAAAGDAAARDRFRAAVERETPRPDSVPRGFPVPGPGEPAPVVAALTGGGAPWVATVYEEGRAGAERFLEPVLLRRGWAGRVRRGPQLQAYWALEPAGPAVWVDQPPPAAVGAAAVEDSRGLAAAVLALAALLGLLALLVLLLFSCEPSQPTAPRPTRTPASSPTSQEPSPSTSPQPTPGRSSTRTPRPTPSGGGQDTENPAGPLRAGRAGG